jgi:uncharacterized alpha-E superfamily protein
MLLSRVAENLYWAARYLERAEGTARVLNEHTNFLVDLPTTVPLTWEPLLAITGSRTDFDDSYPQADEASIVRFLVADRTNPGSILRSIESTRDNMRTTREVLPRQVWQVVNDVYLYLASNALDGIGRSTRGRFLERVIAESQRVRGVLYGTMSRDDAFLFLRLGYNIERADLATRVLDVRASALVDDTLSRAFEDVQWASVLRSLSALQMYHRATRSPVDGPTTLRFLLHDLTFPGSVAHCLQNVSSCIDALPHAKLVSPHCDDALTTLAVFPIDGLSPSLLHDWVDHLQLAIARIHEQIAEAYFRAATADDD